MVAEREAPDIWNRILDREAQSGVAALSLEERRIFYVNRFLLDYENGGLSGFLYNVSPENGTEWLELRSTIDAIAFFDRPEVARALEGALNIVERDGPSGPTWGAFVSARDAEGQLDVIDREVGRCYADLWEDIERAALALPE